MANVVSDLLLTSGILSSSQVKEAQAVMKQKLCSFEEAVLSLQLMSREALYGGIADQLRVPYVELHEYHPDPEAKRLIPEPLARKLRAFPLFRVRDALIVAMADPTDLVAIDALRQASGHTVEAYFASETEVGRAIDEKYGTEGEAERFLKELAAVSAAPGPAAGAGAEAPAAKLADILLTQAVRERASDIHIEPEDALIRVRFRVDGLLREVPSPPKTLEAGLISRLKVMGNLDIAESRIPQDGHFQLKIDERRVDVRLSTLPTVNGENLVLRLLDTGDVSVGLEKLGMSTAAMVNFEEIIRRPHGIILSVGPTGSGKTTTLYSALMRINTMDKNIITVEDPVEYRLGLIRQVQVNPKAGVTFASGLRAILRQDPNIIMVGEIRDRETAEIAIQASLTGHLVFSTLHTNDAPSSITRLLNMGVEPFLVSASVICVMAQRLVRSICPACKTWYEPPAALVKRLGLKSPDGKPVKLARGQGCVQCRKTGYAGRQAIFEMMVIDDELREIIISNPSVIKLREAARRKGMRMLFEDGLERALAGVTTLEEISRVTELRQAEAPEPARE